MCGYFCFGLFDFEFNYKSLEGFTGYLNHIILKKMMEKLLQYFK